MKIPNVTLKDFDCSYSTNMSNIHSLCEPSSYSQAIKQGCWDEAMKKKWMHFILTKHGLWFLTLLI